MPSRNTTRPALYGIPRPTLIPFVTRKTPKFIHFSTKYDLNIKTVKHLLLLSCDETRVNAERFFNTATAVSLLILSTRPISPTPLPLSVISIILSLLSSIMATGTLKIFSTLLAVPTLFAGATFTVFLQSIAMATGTMNCF
ncbi:hypothetical protein EZS27_018683 [termite gut metagenome]|uniref:Uncharacterized protein n=1 Tax=termite gut metagenome TaxID=433724 RepID=A0A5J4RGS0_9ZZZZ